MAGTTGAPSLLIDSSTNHISASSGFSYDPAGNVIKDPSHTYTYNAEGELTAVDASTTYAYDGHRWRMKKTVSGVTTVYIYSGSKVLAEYASGAAPASPTTEYVYSGGSLLATLSGTSVTYHYPDHLSNRLETDSTGNVIRSFGQLPFGETWYEPTGTDKWKFTGYERDSAESGLDYAMNRMYSSGFGRFQMPDLLNGQLQNPQTLNRYTYVANDPVNSFDPTGLNQVKLSAPLPDPCQGSPGCAVFGHTIFDAIDSFFEGIDDGTFFGIDQTGNVQWAFNPPSPFAWEFSGSLYGKQYDEIFDSWDQYADWRTGIAALPASQIYAAFEAICKNEGCDPAQLMAVKYTFASLVVTVTQKCDPGQCKVNEKNLDGYWPDPITSFHDHKSSWYSGFFFETPHLINTDPISAHIDPFGPFNPLHDLIQLPAMLFPPGASGEATCSINAGCVIH